MDIKYTSPIDTTGGKIRGYYQEDGIMVFKGVPYAEAPAGDKRWKAAEKYAYREGVRDCIEFGYSAWQNPIDDFSKRIWTEEFLIRKKEFSEDCLTLNIWAHEGKTGMPVILYFYGGGYVSGGSSCDIYDGTAFARKDVIYISFTHREGIFGWYVNDDLRAETKEGTVGNYMLTDAVKALEWIRDNIEKFGGDPENITIWGQSAGAGEVNLLTVSPVAQDLFSKCVSMGLDSALLKDWVTLDDMCAKGNEIEKKFGGSLEKMRETAPEEFLPYFGDSAPIIDGYFTSYDAKTAVEKGIGSKKPVIMGFMDNDGMVGSWYLKYMMGHNDLEYFRKIVSKLFPGNEEEIEKTYLIDNNVMGAFSRIGHDIMIYGVIEYAKARVKADPDSATYVYIFKHVMPGPDSAMFGAFHSYEIPYFTEHFTELRSEYWTDADRKLGTKMNDELVSFARCGKPLSEGFVKSDGYDLYIINTDEQHNEHISAEEYERLVRLFGKAELWS